MELSDEKIQERKSIFQQAVAGYPWPRPSQLWVECDPQRGEQWGDFVFTNMYGGSKLPLARRQLVAISSLSSLGHAQELRLHIWVGLELGLKAEDITEAIFQTGLYAGVPAMNRGLEVLQEVLEHRKADGV